MVIKGENEPQKNVENNGDTDLVTIYHIEGRRSHRIIWLCEELEIPYKLVFERGDIAGSMTIIRRANPAMALAPSILFRGRLMVESGGIVEYLMSQFAGGNKLAPPETSPDFADYKIWMHFAEGTAMSRLGNELGRIMKTGDRVIEPVTIGPVHLVGTMEIVSLLEAYISEHPFFGGDNFSAADIMLDIVATMIRVLPVSGSAYPNLQKWQKKIQARPAYQRALKAGMPDGVPPDAILRT